MWKNNNSIVKNHWEVINFPKKKVLRNKWIYKIKFDSNANIMKYEEIIFGKGYSQKYGMDYENTFAPRKDKLN